MKPRIMFFDIETRKSAKVLNPKDEQAGWELARKGKGGISALCLYDTRDLSLHMYDDFTANACAQHLEAADLVVGYCSERFDIPCLEGVVGRRLRIAKHIDIYAELARHYAERGITGQKGDFTLDRIAKQNLGHGKIDKGGNVFELIRLGQWGKIFNYCASDVYLTRDLFAVICRDGGLINLGGQFTSLHIPDRYKAGMEAFL